MRRGRAALHERMTPQSRSVRDLADRVESRGEPPASFNRSRAVRGILSVHGCCGHKRRMNVFLTGATGYVGSAVADALRSSGHAVVGLARSDEAAATLAERGVSAHRGDLRDPVSISDGAREADAVVHTALADDSDLWDELDTGAVEACLRALEGGGKPFSAPRYAA